jgi:MATE family multidrug resistance protein
MKANIAAMLANVFFNWLLIDGHWGFPALGVKGAAIASVSASSVAFIGLLTVFLWRSRGLERCRLKLAEFWRVLRFGLPSGLNWSFEFFAFIAFVNVVVASLGTASLAALMAVIQINSVAFMPAFGLASAGSILVGQSIGAGDKNGVPHIVKLTFFSAAAWMGLAALAYVFVPTLILSPFVPAGTDGTFLKVGVLMLMMSSLWQLFDAGGITLTESLRAAGDTAFPMWTRCILAWLVFLPGSWISVKYFGGAEKSAMAWLLLYLGLLSLVLYFRFKNGAWRKIELVPEIPVL